MYPGKIIALKLNHCCRFKNSFILNIAFFTINPTASFYRIFFAQKVSPFDKRQIKPSIT